MAKNQNVWLKIEIYGQKSKCMVKNQNLWLKSQKKSKFSAKIEILGENRNSRQKSKFSAKIEILVKNRNL